jgi:DNA topoisomerase I
MKIVIVESPAKTKTISKYLGKDYQIFASFGHIRDLPSKQGSVATDDNFKLKYEIDADSRKRIKPIADAVKKAESLILATDPDREGEAISWHVLEALRELKKLPKDIKIERVSFNQITKPAVQEAINNPRQIDMDLVNAQQARRALDYLVGFTLSPILWRKLPGSRSAGRVQSVALRILCSREDEIERFESREYWDIDLSLENNKKQALLARLTHIAGKKLEKFSITKQDQADVYTAEINKQDFKVLDIQEKKVKRKPPVPFITSTLQQEASKQLGLPTKITMRIAQKLYEGISINGQTSGLITYMRTDCITMAGSAIKDIRQHVSQKYGAKYIPEKPRIYKGKVKNAQEAHEAIRPTNFTYEPDQIRSSLDDDQYRLYKLIWKRTVASEMQDAEFKQAALDVISTDKKYQARSNGNILVFDGFLKVYSEQDQQDKILPDFAKQEELALTKSQANQHFTEPPPRYSEASLVKKLEELGIGRPSTYSNIISILIDRSYAKLENKRFKPEERGMIVNAFLVSFFQKYVEYDFTAELETELDDVSNGKLTWQEFLKMFWGGFEKRNAEVLETENKEISNKITEFLEHHYFPEVKEGENPRKCPKCDDGILTLKTGKFGAFIACSHYPECKYTKQITDAGGFDSDDAAEAKKVATSADGKEILLKKGPYGHYLEMEPDIVVAEEKPEKPAKTKKTKKAKKPPKPKRVTVPKNINIADIDQELALQLINLPREIGIHPETEKVIKTNFGRFGPYLLHDSKFTSVPAADNILTLTLARALEIMEEAKKKGKGGGSIAEFTHSKDSKPIQIKKGRYGAYIKYNSKNFAITKNLEAEKLTLADVEEIIAKGATKSKKKK